MSTRLLICDDDPFLLRALEIRFREAGYEVECAGDGEDAWQLMDGSPPDVLVTDYRMPQLDGCQLAQRVRDHAHTRDVAIVMITSWSFDPKTKTAAEQLDISRVVAKPFSPRVLVEIVEELAPAGSK